MSNIEGNHKSLREGTLYAFAGFTLDTAAGLLTHSGEPVKLAPKVYQLLVHLVENRDRIVSKDELFTAVWQGAFVEDNALSFTVSQLRKSLTAYESETTFVQTVPRRGFRFVANVSETNAGLVERKPSGLVVERQVVEETWIEEVNEPDHPIPANYPALTGGRSVLRRSLIFSVGAVLILVFGFAVWQFAIERDRPTRSTVRSIAVLPVGTFENEEVDPALRMKITDSLIAKLGNIDSLSVRPTISVASFDRETTDPLDFGRRLEVDAILDGRIHKDADKLRVTIQLISVATGDNLWSDQFDGRADRLLDLQDAISLRLIDVLDVRLSSGEKADLQKRPTLVAEAYEEYLRGRYFWTTRSKDGLKNAIAAFEKAIALDPQYAGAYVGLADSYYLLVDYSYDTSPANIALAKENLSKAIALSPDSAEAHATLGHIQSTIEWNWEAAEESLKTAIRLSPNSPNAHHRLGMLYLKLRRFGEAANELDTARRLDPTSLSINMNLGVVYCFSGRNAEAMGQFNKTVDLDQRFIPVKWYIARCERIGGRIGEALSAFREVNQKAGDNESARIIEAGINTKTPESIFAELAESWKKRLSPTGFNPHDIAFIEAMSGDAEQAVYWLERAAEERHPWASWINCEPEFEFLRNNERFNALLTKMNLRRP